MIRDLLLCALMFALGVLLSEWVLRAAKTGGAALMSRPSPWSAEMLGRGRALWDDGHSAREIARALAFEFDRPVTYSAVAGQAHRKKWPIRGLPGAFSPGEVSVLSGRVLAEAKVPPGGRALSWQMRPAHALPAEVREALSSAKPKAEPRPPAPRPAAPPRPKAPEPAEPVPPPTVFKPRASCPCRWPLGEVGRPGFRYCDAASAPGKSYCPEHYAIAYTPVPQRRVA